MKLHILVRLVPILAASACLPLTAEDFVTCIGWAGTTNPCVLPQGVYNIGPSDHAALVVQRSGITVQGVCANCSTIKRNDRSVGSLMTVYGSNVIVQNLIFDGSSDWFPNLQGNNYSDLWLQGGSNSVIASTFRKSSFNAIQFNGSNAGFYNSQFTNGSNAGILGGNSGTYITNFWIESCVFHDYKGAALAFARINYGTIYNNQFHHTGFQDPNQAGSGQVYLSPGTSNVIIQNNTFDGEWQQHSSEYTTSESYGIEIDGASHIQTFYNTINNHAIAGIWVGQSANNIRIEHDTLQYNGFQGIDVANSPYNIALLEVTATNNTNQQNNPYFIPYGLPPIAVGWRSPPSTYYGLHLASSVGSGALCIENSTLAPNGGGGPNYNGDIYLNGSGQYYFSSSCPRY